MKNFEREAGARDLKDATPNELSLAYHNLNASLLVNEYDRDQIKDAISRYFVALHVDKDINQNSNKFHKASLEGARLSGYGASLALSNGDIEGREMILGQKDAFDKLIERSE